MRKEGGVQGERPEPRYATQFPKVPDERPGLPGHLKEVCVGRREAEGSKYCGYRRKFKSLIHQCFRRKEGTEGQRASSSHSSSKVNITVPTHRIGT